MSIKNKFKSFFTLDDEEYEYEYIDEERVPFKKKKERRTKQHFKIVRRQENKMLSACKACKNPLKWC
ncbi:hypothetical protein BSAF29S_02298 [Bacillus safensis subsp. safensis]